MSWWLALTHTYSWRGRIPVIDPPLNSALFEEYNSPHAVLCFSEASVWQPISEFLRQHSSNLVFLQSLRLLPVVHGFYENAKFLTCYTAPQITLIIQHWWIEIQPTQSPAWCLRFLKLDFRIQFLDLYTTRNSARNPVFVHVKAFHA